MSLPQQKFREIVFQILFSYDLAKPKEEEIIPLLMKELSVTKSAVKQALIVAKKIIDQQKEIDEKIRKISLSYDFERIQVIERNILRLGIFELFYETGVPPKVAISEAMRLTRKFSTPESSAFVNALLDHLYQASLGKPTDDKTLTKTIDNLVESEERSQKAAPEE